MTQKRGKKKEAVKDEKVLPEIIDAEATTVLVKGNDDAPFEELPEPTKDISMALMRLDEARQRALVNARGKDLHILDVLEKKIDDALAIMTEEKLSSAKPKDLAIILGILLDKREQLLGFDPTRGSARQRKKATFQYAFDMGQGRGAVSIEIE